MAGDEEIFMRQVLDVINSTPNHPLARLVNPDTGSWWGRTPWGEAAEDHPTVQAGHRLSKWAGGDRLALQDSESNQLEGRFAEGKWRQGVHVERDAIEIGGVPVDLEAAKAWEKEGVIPPGTVANALSSSGWQRGDTLVAPPPDAYPSGTHSESLPGGAGTTIITGDGASAVLMAGMSDLAHLLGGGVTVMGTLALLDALSELSGGKQGQPADQPDDDAPSTQPPVKEPPPPKDPPVKEPPKDPPPKDPPVKEPPAKEPPKDPPPAAPAQPDPPAPPPPPAGGSGDSSGGIPGASGGGPAAPEESSPAPSGGTSSVSTDHSSLLAFSYFPSDGSDAVDVPSEGRGSDGFDVPAPGSGFDGPGIDDGFYLPAPGSGFDGPGIDDGFYLPAPGSGFDGPGIDDGFYLPAPDDRFETSGGGFDIPRPDEPFSIPAPETGFDGPGPVDGFDTAGPSVPGELDDDYAIPPSFDGGPR